MNVKPQHVHFLVSSTNITKFLSAVLHSYHSEVLWIHLCCFQFVLTTVIIIIIIITNPPLLPPPHHLSSQSPLSAPAVIANELYYMTEDWRTGNEDREREGERGYSWWNRETSSHYDKQERKKAATFSKCHFGNFQLNSDNNSLSSTLGCLDALFSAQLKTILWCCGEENSKNTFLLWLEQYKVHSNPEALSELS